MSRRKRIDGNQAAIVEGLRQLGVFVEPRLARVGEGVPDLLVYHRGHWWVVEVKQPREALTTDEQEWWTKVGYFRCQSDSTGTVGKTKEIWTSLDDARKTLGL